tara:strand:+ start:1071 stop:1958 length:888 start_codon:yes stop_codon:yes gene_type:complete
MTEGEPEAEAAAAPSQSPAAAGEAAAKISEDVTPVGGEGDMGDLCVAKPDAIEVMRNERQAPYQPTAEPADADGGPPRRKRYDPLAEWNDCAGMTLGIIDILQDVMEGTEGSGYAGQEFTLLQEQRGIVQNHLEEYDAQSPKTRAMLEECEGAVLLTHQELEQHLNEEASTADHTSSTLASIATGVVEDSERVEALIRERLHGLSFNFAAHMRHTKDNTDVSEHVERKLAEHRDRQAQAAEAITRAQMSPGAASTGQPHAGDQALLEMFSGLGSTGEGRPSAIETHREQEVSCSN